MFTPRCGTQPRALLRHAGRQRCIDAEADRLHAILRAEYLHQPPLVENALGQQVLALLRQLDTASANADELATAVIEQFQTHPDAAIIASRPGLGALTGARVLAEIGDYRSRFADTRALKAYRRRRTRDPRQRQDDRGDAPADQEPPTRRRRLPLGSPR